MKPKRSLGRGLTALIPESDIDFLKSVARGEAQPAPVKPAKPQASTADSTKASASATNTAAKAPVKTITGKGASESKAKTLAPTAKVKGTPPAGAQGAPAGEVSVPSQAAVHQKTDAPNLDATMANETPETEPVTAIELAEQHPANAIRHIGITTIQPNPFQPRQIFDENELEDLANSIKEHGVLQPILVRPIPDEARTESNRHLDYQLIAGERRWRACTRAGLTEVPAIIRTVSDLEALELALIENVQRHDIGPIESAEAYRRLATEFSLSQEEISKRVGKSRAAVANTMRLLDLPAEAVNALKEGKITEGHGRALLTAAGDGARRALLRRILRDELSVREVERLAREATDPDVKTSVSSPVRTPDLERLERTLQKALGTRLKLKPRRRGGQIVIDFFSPEDLQRLVGHLTGLKPLRPTGDNNPARENAAGTDPKGE